MHFFVHTCLENTCKLHLNDRLLQEIPWSCHVPRTAKGKERKNHQNKEKTPQNLLDLSTMWKSLV